MTVVKNVRLLCLLFFCLPFCVRVCAYVIYRFYFQAFEIDNTEIFQKPLL